MRLLGKPGTRHRPRSPQPGPVDQTACLSETDIAFVGAGRAPTETGVAFADEKWVFLARFSVALVLSVSMVAVQGRALVMVVSCWPASVPVEVSLVSKSPWVGSCARKSSPCSAWCGCVSAKKFARRSKNVPKWAFWGVLGEFLRGDAAGGVVVGELCRPLGLTGLRASRCLPDPR